jgi:hypothetical protein
MKAMRVCLCLLAIAGYLSAADLQPGQPLRGKLSVRDGKPTTISTSDRKTVALDGDDNSMKVLSDKRLDGFDVEVRGHFTSPGHFQLDPMHTHSLLVRKDGKLKLVTYWCDICNIRAYTPGPCACCQKETLLDLRDPDAQDQ